MTKFATANEARTAGHAAGFRGAELSEFVIRNAPHARGISVEAFASLKRAEKLATSLMGRWDAKVRTQTDEEAAREYLEMDP